MRKGILVSIGALLAGAGLSLAQPANAELPAPGDDLAARPGQPAPLSVGEARVLPVLAPAPDVTPNLIAPGGLPALTDQQPSGLSPDLPGPRDLSPHGAESCAGPTCEPPCEQNNQFWGGIEYLLW